MRGYGIAAVMTLGACSVLGTTPASCQDFPSKPVRLVTGGPGSTGDFASRLLAQGLTAAIGQQVIVDNRISGAILGDVVGKSPPDGYTLLITGSSFWLLPFFQSNLPWDPIKDFVPVTLAVSSPNILAVHPSLPVKSLKEMIALARARPGELNYGSGPVGTSNHLGAELFKSMARVNIVRVPYKGVGHAVNDLIGGQVQLAFPVAASAMPHVKSGRLRALVVLSAKPTPQVPGVPTATESGLPGFEIDVSNGVFAPARTPAAIVNRLNQDIVRILSQPEIRQKYLNGGVDVVGSSAAHLAALVKSDMTTLGKLIQDLGLRND